MGNDNKLYGLFLASIKSTGLESSKRSRAIENIVQENRITTKHSNQPVTLS